MNLLYDDLKISWKGTFVRNWVEEYEISIYARAASDIFQS